MEREEEKNGKEEIDQFKRGTGDHAADVGCMRGQRNRKNRIM